MKTLQDYTDQTLLDRANNYMDALMQASTERHYQNHIQHFSKRLKQMLDERHFYHVVDEYQHNKGLFTTREFVASFRRTDSFAVVWRQKFSKIEGDYVAELVLTEEEGQLVVDHVMVF